MASFPKFLLGDNTDYPDAIFIIHTEFPLCYYLGLHTPLKTTGIWIGLLIGLAFSALLQTARFLLLSGRLIKKSSN